MNRECVRHLLVRSGEGGDRVGRQEGDMFNTTGMLYAFGMDIDMILPSELQQEGSGDDRKTDEKQIYFPVPEGKIIEIMDELGLIVVTLQPPPRQPPPSATSSAPAPSVLLPTENVLWAKTTS